MTTQTEGSISYARRVGYAALSGLAGWLAAQVITLPVHLITAVRDSEGQARLFVQTLSYGLLAWAGWTLLLASVGWLLAALPLVLLVRPCLLVKARHWLMAIAIAIAAAAVASQLKGFRDPAGVSPWQRFALMLPYGCFGLTYGAVTAATYIQLCKRRLYGGSASQDTR